MLKYMLGSLVRAAVSVSQERLELLARIASDIAHDNPRGEDWFEHYGRVRKEGLPAPQFERNKNGHIVIPITGLDLTGQQEIDRLTAAGFSTSDWVKSCLLSIKNDGYDKRHRLREGREYMLALVPTKDVPGERTTADGRVYGASFGYEQPFAGAVPRLREAVSDEVMEKMGLWYIVVLHDPITDSGGRPDVLDVDRSNGGQWVDASWDRPGVLWSDRGAFAFVVPAS